MPERLHENVTASMGSLCFLHRASKMYRSGGKEDGMINYLIESHALNCWIIRPLKYISDVVKAELD